jgi:hypothetical protein
MKNDPQAERAFGNLIKRKSREADELELTEAKAEIVRLRASRRKFLKTLKSVVDHSNTLPEQLYSLDKIGKLIADYENEY